MRQGVCGNTSGPHTACVSQPPCGCDEEFLSIIALKVCWLAGYRLVVTPALEASRLGSIVRPPSAGCQVESAWYFNPILEQGVQYSAGIKPDISTDATWRLNTQHLVMQRLKRIGQNMQNTYRKRGWALHCQSRADGDLSDYADCAAAVDGAEACHCCCFGGNGVGDATAGQGIVSGCRALSGDTGMSR